MYFKIISSPEDKIFTKPTLCSLSGSAFARVQSLIPFAVVPNALLISNWASSTVMLCEVQRCLITTVILAIKRTFPWGTWAKWKDSEEDLQITNVTNAGRSLIFQEQLIMAEKGHHFPPNVCSLNSIKSLAAESTFCLTRKSHCCKASPRLFPLVILHRPQRP